MRDLVGLQRLAEIVAETERVKPAFAGLERLWRGVDTDIPRLDRMIAWAKDTREAIRAFGTETDDAEWLRQHVVMLLTDYAHLFAPDGATRKAFDALEEGAASTWAALDALGKCVGLADPRDLVEPRSDWDEELIQRTSRWKANILKAPEWARWRAAAFAGKNVGLGSLIDAIETGTVTTTTIQPVFEFSYARWFAEKIVDEDEVPQLLPRRAARSRH